MAPLASLWQLWPACGTSGQLVAPMASWWHLWPDSDPLASCQLSPLARLSPWEVGPAKHFHLSDKLVTRSVSPVLFVCFNVVGLSCQLSCLKYFSSSIAWIVHILITMHNAHCTMHSAQCTLHLLPSHQLVHGWLGSCCCLECIKVDYTSLEIVMYCISAPSVPLKLEEFFFHVHH